MGRLDGHVAIVTGGAKGIGVHYARTLAAEGARLMIADVADGKEVAESLARQHGANSVASAITDVSDETAVKALVAETMARFGQIDVLVNNAALFAPLRETKCTEIDAAVWDRVMAINLRGPFLMVKHVAPHMSTRGYGKIINIGSGSIFHGIPSMLHYVTSKGGVMAMTRAMALELGEHGIRVNTLSPGLTLRNAHGGKSRAYRQRAQARACLALPQARPPSAGPARRSGLPDQRRKRLHDRAERLGRRRQRQYLVRCAAAPALHGGPAFRAVLRGRLGRIFPYCLPEHLFFGSGAGCRGARFSI